MSYVFKLNITFIICLSLFRSAAQKNDLHPTHSFLSKSDSILLDSLYNLSYDLSFYDSDSALTLIEEYLNISKKNNNYKIEGGLVTKGYIHIKLGNHKTALDCFFKF